MNSSLLLHLGTGPPVRHAVLQPKEDPHGRDVAELVPAWMLLGDLVSKLSNEAYGGCYDVLWARYRRYSLEVS